MSQWPTIAVRCEYAGAFTEHSITIVGPIPDVDAFVTEFVDGDTPVDGGYVDWEFINGDGLVSIEALRVERDGDEP